VGVDQGQRRLLQGAAEGIAKEIARKAPGGPTGRAGRDVEGRAVTSTTAVIRSRGFPGAMALERGATIRPKKGKALKMRDGRFVRGKVVIRGHGYWRKGLRQRGKIVRGVFHDAFGDLERGG
jgi:hypothetical protein